MANRITHAKEIQKKSRGYSVRRVGPNWFKVSTQQNRQEYNVNLGLNGGTCTCAWGQHRPKNDRRSGCSHVVAAMHYRARQHGQRISVWSTPDAARRQHRPMVPIGDGLILTSRPN